MTVVELLAGLKQFQGTVQSKNDAVMVYAVINWLVMMSMREMLKYGDELLPIMYHRYVSEKDPVVKDALFELIYETCFILADLKTTKREK
jgi:hypothetical protein